MLGGLDRNLYGPVRVRQVVRMLQKERSLLQKVLLRRVDLRELFAQNRAIVEQEYADLSDSDPSSTEEENLDED